jgi:hypothetical protein
MTAAIARLKENTPPAILDRARRIADAEVLDDPQVAALRQRQSAVDIQQRALMHQVEAARAKTAAAALLGDPAAEKAYHDACFAAAKAQRILDMYDIGKPALVAEHDRLIANVRGLGASSATLGNEIADASFVARIAEAHRRMAARK